VSEDVGSVSVAVSLQNGILARDVVVTLQTLDGTAMGEFHLKSQDRLWSIHTMEPFKSPIIFIPKPIGGMDFSNVSVDLTFKASSPSQTVMVPILNDTVPEDLEYFRVALVSNDPAVIFNAVTASINVLDDIDSTLKSPNILNSAISYFSHAVQYTVDIVSFSCFSGHNRIQHYKLLCL